MKIKLIVFPLLLLFITACSIFNSNQSNDPKQSSDQQENKATIINQTQSDIISDYSAEVSITSSNSRIAHSESILTDYQMFTKIIDNQLYTRIDYPEQDGYYRSVISTPEESIVFDRQNNEVFHRVDASPLYSRKLDSDTLFPKTDISEVKNVYNKLSFKTTENLDDNILVVDYPEEVLMDLSISDTVKSNKLYYDLTAGTLVKEEKESVTEDNVKIKTVIESVYEEINGVQVLVKTIESISYDFPYTIDASDSQLPVVESEDDIPVITEAELEAMLSEGAEILNTDVIIGDQSNPDYTETITTTYKSIELNSLSNTYFRFN